MNVWINQSDLKTYMYVYVYEMHRSKEMHHYSVYCGQTISSITNKIWKYTAADDDLNDS